MRFLTKDSITAVTVILFSTIGYLYCTENTIPGESEIGSMYTPKLLCVCLLVLGTVKFINAIREAEAGKAPSATRSFLDRRTLFNGVGTIILTGLYCSLFHKLGFVIMTFLYLVGQMALFCPNPKERWWIIILVAIFASVAMFLVFSIVFGLMLPLGPFDNLLAF